MSVDPSAPSVKRRPYDSSRRSEQAARSRAAVLASARALFLRSGVQDTTVATIAEESGVSVDTVYKTFGGKAGLLRALCEQALEGTGEVPAETRSDLLQAVEHDPRAVLRGLGALTAEVAPRIAPLVLLLPVAGGELGALRSDLESARLARMRLVASRLAAGGRLRPGLTADAAADLLWTYSSPELFGLLVLGRGWSPDRFGAFVGRSLIAALLPD
ncbi:TetR/AcrR family transcriptional regulator [Amnibacterium sp.]|uniref:TetR/AcrR family transcriptional regulator n=1 Tax=Amnibacterium sp. TaxID=1872496 RepID=UPI00261E54AB|nr:TetR/AcrR family transcriptional regulator [Amnibacterium sp.]